MSGPTTRSNRTRIPVEISLRGRSRQGCWTCRIRRKKCDEEMDGEGLCHNCSRLGIKCIGWGEKRPEWLKDPEKLDRFKQSMKNQIVARTRSSSNPITDSTLSMPSTQMVNPNHQTRDMPASGAVLLASCWETANDITLPPVTNPPPYDPVPSRGMAASVSPRPSLPGSVLRPAPLMMDPYDYRSFVKQVQILADSVGLPTHCVLPIRETVELGLWKHEQLDRGCLSFRELVKRSHYTEQKLLPYYEEAKVVPRIADTSAARRPLKVEEMFQFMDFPGDLDRYMVPNPDFPMAPSIPLPGVLPQGSVQPEVWSGIPFDLLADPSYPPPPQLSAYFDLSGASDELLTPEDHPQEYTISPRAPATIPYLASLLFLYTIVSGINQQVPEIALASKEIIDILKDPITRGAVPKMQALFAIVLVACLSDNPEVSDIFTRIITTIDDDAVRVSATALVHKTGGLYVL